MIRLCVWGHIKHHLLLWWSFDIYFTKWQCILKKIKREKEKKEKKKKKKRRKKKERKRRKINKMVRNGPMYMKFGMYVDFTMRNKEKLNNWPYLDDLARGTLGYFSSRAFL